MSLERQQACFDQIGCVSERRAQAQGDATSVRAQADVVGFACARARRLRPFSRRVLGRRAKRLALAAFYDYAIVGRQWALSGQARVRGLRTAAVGHARIAARYARRGSALLLAAKRLLG